MSGTFLGIMWTVGWYELKEQLRSKTVIIYMVITIIFSLLLIKFMTDEMKSAFLNIAPSIPYRIFLRLNFFQALFTVFFASHFFTQESGASTSESLSVHSFSNAAYIWGKALGVSMIVMINVTAIALISGIIAFLLPSARLSVTGFFIYPFMVTAPVVLFIVGLTFLFMTFRVFKPLVLLFMIAYIVYTVVSLDNSYHYLFDFMGAHIPLLMSEFSGFSNVSHFLQQRCVFALTGLGCIALAGIAYGWTRFPQSRRTIVVNTLLTAAFFGGAGLCGFRYIDTIKDGAAFRSQIISLNTEYAAKQKPAILFGNLDVVHDRRNIEVTAAMSFRNASNEPLKEYSFTLNPGLAVDSVRGATGPLSFERDLHIVTIMPKTPLQPNGIDSLTIHYRGTIDERACYVDIGEHLRTICNTDIMLPIDKRYSFVTPRYCLLTQESMWYPSTRVFLPERYDIETPPFVRYSLHVKTNAKLTAISQGRCDNTGGGEFRFTPEQPLAKLSLIIGDYARYSVDAEGVEYSIYYLDGRDFFSHYFSHLKESLPKYINELKNQYEYTLSLDYPYKRFAMVEVPVQFLTYPRLLSVDNETLQPEQVLIQEKDVCMKYGTGRFDSNKKRFAKGAQTDHGNVYPTEEEIEKHILRNFALLNFFNVNEFEYQQALLTRQAETSGALRDKLTMGFNHHIYDYNLFPLYCSGVRFESIGTSLFGAAFEYYLKSRMRHTKGSFVDSFSGRNYYYKTHSEVAAGILADQSLLDAAHQTKDSYLFSCALQSKAEQFWLYMEARYGRDRFREFVRSYLNGHAFTTIDEGAFLAAIESTFGYDMKHFIETWQNEPGIPVYDISDPVCVEIKKGDRDVYKISFEALNYGKVDGTIQFTYSITGTNNTVDIIDRYYFIEAGQKKEISILSETKPYNTMTINTMLSQNVPQVSTALYPSVPDNIAEIFEGERIVDSVQSINREHGIIVDNESPGFSIRSIGKKALLQKYVTEKTDNTDVSERIDLWQPPKKWKKVQYRIFYASHSKQRTGLLKKAGKGEESVRWTAEIGEPGIYRVFFNVPDFTNEVKILRTYPKFSGKNVFGDFHFRLTGGGNTQEITVDIDNASSGWLQIGTMTVSDGTATVELGDKTNGLVIFADAVKWEKIEGAAVN